MVRNKMPEYEAYKCMKKRCYTKSCKDYTNYGGRGICVSDEWLGENGFINFLSDMGFRPTNKHSVDRIDPNGDYCKENCRWATQKEQAINHRRNWVVYIDGEWVDGVSAAKILKVGYSSLINGMSGAQKMPKKYRNNIIFKRREELSNQ